MNDFLHFFGRPWFLLLLLLLPLLAWLKGRRGVPPAFVYSSVQLVRGMQNITRSRSGGFLGALRWLVLGILIIALAEPHSMHSHSQVKASGIDIVCALDLSGSMNTRDYVVNGMQTSRFEMAKPVVEDFIKGRPDDRIG